MAKERVGSLGRGVIFCCWLVVVVVVMVMMRGREGCGCGCGYGWVVLYDGMKYPRSLFRGKMRVGEEGMWWCGEVLKLKHICARGLRE